MKDENSYKEWEATATTEYSEQPDRETDRAVYIVDGVRIFDHTVLPWNFMKKSYKYTVIGLQFPETSKNKGIVMGFGGELSADWYCSDGYKMPIFGEADGKDPLEKAWNFIKHYKESGLIEGDENA